MAHALIFDSGVGGLSVAAEIRALMPDLRMSYVADDVFRPYGNKSEAALRARLPGLIATLVEATQADMVVIACNTASTTALSDMRAAVSVPVIGVVPAIKPAARDSETGVIAVLGTPGTVRRDYVDGLIRDFAADKTVILQGSTALVALAEEKLAGKAVSPDMIRQEIAPIFDDPQGDRVDHIVLACTHFPLLREEFMALSPRSVSWIDSGSAVARRVKAVRDSLTDLNPHPGGPDTALLIGDRVDAVRAQAFKDYGFEKTVALLT